MAKADITNVLEAGNPAPLFDLPGNGGTQLSLGSFRGKNVVIFFYPKDNTPGCTKESIEFGDSLKEFASANTEILGISADSVLSHDKFIAKQNLKLRLASDEDKQTIEAYGVWVEKINYGRKYMGIERSTFLIDIAGNIAQIWRKVRVKGHVEKVLEAAQQLP